MSENIPNAINNDQSYICSEKHEITIVVSSIHNDVRMMLASFID
jgi:hypothetical protein